VFLHLFKYLFVTLRRVFFKISRVIKLRALILLLALMLSINVLGQQGFYQVDSLKKVLVSTHDSAKSVIYNQIIWKLRNSNPSEAIQYGKFALENAEKYKLYEQVSKAYSFLGVAYRNLGDFKRSKEYYMMGLEVAKQHKLKEQLGYANINIGNWYLYNDDYKPSEAYILASAKIAEELADERMIAYCNLNLGRFYLLSDKLLDAQNYIEKSLIFRVNTNDISGQAVCYKYLADLYHANGNDIKALQQYQLTLDIIDKQFDKDLLADIYNKMSDIYLSLGKVSDAKQSAEMGLDVALQTKNYIRIRHAYQAHVNIFRQQGNSDKALYFYEYVKQYNDTVFRNQLEDKISFDFLEFERHKEKLRTDSAEQRAVLEKTLRKKERRLNITLSIVLILSLVLMYLLLKANKRRKQMNLELISQKEEIQTVITDLHSKNEEIIVQRDEIEIQRDAIERQQVSITDSILYAQRIQQAMLFNQEEIRNIVAFPFFILYLPRDIVSGDFYWVRKIENKLIFTVADCTGHGIPGAFLSMLGISLLNEIVVNQKTTDAAEILNKLRNQIKNHLNQTDDRDSLDDGMDMALCVLNTETLELEFAGANNPAYIARGNTILTLEPTLNPVGIYFRERPFEKQTFRLESDDTIYLFSDGYADQFGGKYGRRFMTNNFKNLLLKIQKHKLGQRRELLEQKLHAWRKHHRQIDDITVMGIKIS